MKNFRQCLYLHGFASGPHSEKARFFAQRLEQRGLQVHVPDLNEPAFEDLTITRQLQQVEKLAQTLQSDSSLLVLGSSMGGLLATLLAERLSHVGALVLFAPGFALNKRWHELLGAEQLHQWKTQGAMDVFHHAVNCQLPLKYKFIEDAETYQTENLKVQVQVPTLVFHGVNDDVVPIAASQQFVEHNQPVAQLEELTSDHGLLDVLPQMWERTSIFLDHVIGPVGARR